MITWGISGNSHDASLAVFRHQPWNKDSCLEILFASHSERYSGKKNDAHLNSALINDALNYGEPEEVIWYENPYKKTLRQIYARQGYKTFKKNRIRTYLRNFNIRCPVRFVDHHRAHCAGGFYTSGFTDATVVCIDSIGEFETLSIWNAEGTKLKRVYSQGYPHSVGLWYSAMTQRIALKPQEDEYILMGMAAYGDPNRFYTSIHRDLLTINNLGSNPLIYFKENLHRGCLWWQPEYNSPQDILDIASSTQKVYEEIFDHVLKQARMKTRSKNLVVMGGCALNCSANSLAYNYFDNVWIMPNPGDAGSAIGAVLGYYDKHIEWPGPFLGHNIEGDYPYENIIQELKKTGIVGVANGRAEFGPRALGNRSLIADPRGVDVKDRVNAIKHRQQFRPFAPAIISDRVADYFDGPTGPYMQFTATCRQPDAFPAIVHADGTSRVQTVSKSDNPGFRRLLELWEKETGCPILLNTSLNIKGKPIVNDELDATQFAKHYGVKVFCR